MHRSSSRNNINNPTATEVEDLSKTTATSERLVVRRIFVFLVEIPSHLCSEPKGSTRSHGEAPSYKDYIPVNPTVAMGIFHAPCLPEGFFLSHYKDPVMTQDFMECHVPGFLNANFGIMENLRKANGHQFWDVDSQIHQVLLMIPKWSLRTTQEMPNLKSIFFL